jgi:hypothetical protein
MLGCKLESEWAIYSRRNIQSCENCIGNINGALMTARSFFSVANRFDATNVTKIFIYRSLYPFKFFISFLLFYFCSLAKCVTHSVAAQSKRKQTRHKDSACNDGGVMNRHDTRHRDDEIRARVALHKRKHIPVLLRARLGRRNTSKASGFDASHRIRSLVEIYTIPGLARRVETSARIAPFHRFFSTAIVHRLMVRCCRRCRT